MTATRRTWNCDRCTKLIKHGGVIAISDTRGQYPSSGAVKLGVYHGKCNPARSAYQIDLERTHSDELDDWINHLRTKLWGEEAARLLIERAQAGGHAQQRSRWTEGVA